MNEALEERLARVPSDGGTVKGEFHDVFAFDELGSLGAGKKIGIGIIRIAHADMAKSVAYPLRSQNAVGRHHIIQKIVMRRHE